jgi:hypothetical protein
MKNTEIEGKLFELVKACINNEDFVINQKETNRQEYYHNHSCTPIKIRTGVRVDNYSVVTLRQDHGYDTHKKSHNISVEFENEPRITIQYTRIGSETKIETKEIIKDREDYGWLIRTIRRLFVSDKYTELVDNEVIIYEYKYILRCGEFKVELTEEQVEELVELYNTNIIEFNKNKQSSEIISRIKKFIK